MPSNELSRDESRIDIIGGSVAGLSLAALLHAAQFRNVTVHELAREQSPRSGGGIALDDPALWALDQLGFSMPDIAVHMQTNGSIQSDGSIKPLEMCARPWRSSWEHLATALRTKLPPGSYRPGERLVGIGGAENGRPIAQFKGPAGSVATDLLVIADGINSTGRQLLAPGGRTPENGGFATFRGIIPLEHLAGLGLKEFSIGRFGYQADGVSFVAYPMPIGTYEAGQPARMGLNWNVSVAVPERALMELFAKDSVEASIFVPGANPGPVVKWLQGRASDAMPPPVAEIVRATDPSQIFGRANGYYLPQPHEIVFPEQRALLMGDAAFWVIPQTGWGANLAAMQARLLTEEFSAVADGSKCLGDALDSYATRTWPTASHYYDKSRAEATRRGLDRPDHDSWGVPEMTTTATAVLPSTIGKER